MSVSASDLLVASGGQIDPSLMAPASEDDVLARVMRWLAQGETRALGVLEEDDETLDEAATEWAYYRWFESACILFAGTPASQDVKDSASMAYTDAQRKTFCDLAAAHRATFDVLVPVPVEVANPLATGPWSTLQSFRRVER